LTSKPYQCKELEVWDNSQAFSLHQSSNEGQLNTKIVEVQLRFETKAKLGNIN
jgi:hypothetical protein